VSVSVGGGGWAGGCVYILPSFTSFAGYPAATIRE